VVQAVIDIDEAMRLAQFIVDVSDEVGAAMGTGKPEGDDKQIIARALLALRPVWEAAQAWSESSNPERDLVTRRNLIRAIDAARKEQP
jgi:hypothetical protein